ncbi:MAG: glycosyltransferase family 4 protein [Acidobacteriia bacterium]|nr:glycosyltransferase family 4 protein [Terriglobia bacterium]
MPAEKRILHIVPALFGEKGIVGGAERYALELAQHMAQEAPTTLAAFGDSSEERQVNRLRLRVLGPPWYVRGQRANPVTASLFSEIRRADVVHCHQEHILASSLASLVCRLTGRKVYVSDLGGGGWDISAYISTERWYNGHLHISEYSRVISGHVSRPWAHVIYGGVDTGKFSPDESVERDGTVLFVGRILPHKGIDDLIRAIPPDMHLEIIGYPYDRRYQSDLQALADGKRVTFRPHCDDTALVHAYRRALCLVLPSVYRTMYGEESKVPELLGQTLLEGMACATPAICTDVASMPEVVDDAVTGFVVPPNDPESLRAKILWLRDHPVEARSMGEAGRLRILKKFTWPAVVRRCLEIYQS